MGVMGRTMVLAAGLGGAVAASQLPEFAQQYRQRIGGAIDELKPMVERFDQEAQAAGTDRGGALQRLARNPDSLARDRGQASADMIARLDRLEGQQAAMRGAGPFARIAVPFEDPDPQLMNGTWRDFEPAVPTTIEGAVAAGAGFLGGAGLVGLLRWPFRRRRPARVRVAS
jgi:hypothetical protein